MDKSNFTCFSQALPGNVSDYVGCEYNIYETSSIMIPTGVRIIMVSSNREQTIQQAEPNWKIITANWRDYTQLYHLERACFPSEDMWPFWDLLGVLTLPDLVRLKACFGLTMVGFISGEKDKRRGRGWITTLGVLPAFRRRGIAQALLERCETELGFPVVRLSVRASNQAAVNLYLRAGYQQVGRWKKYYVGGEDGLVLEKHVDLF